jgi:hypothetical protein
MSLKKRLRTIFLCAALELGVLSGVPMRPEEIRALMNQINQPTMAHVLPTDDQGGDDPPERLLRSQPPSPGPPERRRRRDGNGGRQIQIEDPDRNPVALFEPAR